MKHYQIHKEALPLPHHRYESRESAKNALEEIYFSYINQADVIGYEVYRKLKYIPSVLRIDCVYSKHQIETRTYHIRKVETQSVKA